MNLGDTYKNKRILFLGATGFVGKVALSLLLRNYPDVGRVFALVRPGAGSSSEHRFFHKVVESPVFDPLREQHGADFDAFLRAKVSPLPGDAGRPDLNFTAEDFERLGHIDVIINSAGLVSFTPSLDTALRINTMGVKYVRDVAKKVGAGVVHVSTCFVAGNRDGEIYEDEELRGYFPRRGELRDRDFGVDTEIADCERAIAQVKTMADDRAHVSLFRDRAARWLEEQGRDPDDERTLRLAVARERKLWVARQLTDLGMERAKHWGWPNIYTYTKSLGDQILAEGDVPFALVRPSIVETSVRYPFPGWNEGFTTSAPLAFIILKGHRNVAAHPKANLDLVPVDFVGSTIVAAAGAVMAGTHKQVYHASTSDTAPLPMPRAVELTALHARRHWRDRGTGNHVLNQLRSRMLAVPVSKERFRALSAPALKGMAESGLRLLDEVVPTWGAPRVQGQAERLRDRLEGTIKLLGQATDLFELFMPFIHDRHYVFRSDNVRELFASLSPDDRANLVWEPENIQWRDYWLNIHMPALKKWIFPDLEEEFRAKPKSVYTYSHLLELFDSTCKLHRNKVAMRLLPPPGADDPIRRFTYKQLHAHAMRGAAILRESGVEPGDNVLLMGEGRPSWGITYFAILKAGATVVPVDAGATGDEVANIARAARVRLAVVSERLQEETEIPSALATTTLIGFDDLYLREPQLASDELDVQAKGDHIASVIFTSGTTGTPKGVMLSHKNFTSLLSKMAAVFDLSSHDRLLSVLPLHHTFEFTVGLLMPLMRGAQITYLDRVETDDLNAAFDEGEVTAMIGVPALWQLLHRKVKKNVSELGPWGEELFDALVDGSRKIRDATGLNVGKFLFRPVHKQLGGRVRLMVSGGSALPPDVMKAFVGMGFSLYEGYGLTEASPVLTVVRPGSKLVPGSVGEALPGVEVRIDDPDEHGVGEVVARGPNVMEGYFENAEATAHTVRDGWLHTGDLGRLDDQKRLFIVGRKKEMILGAAGENVYPDELEELYRDHEYIKELSIVGLPGPDGGEIVAAMVVPDSKAKDTDDEPVPREDIRAAIVEHMRHVSHKLPPFKRVKVFHFWDHDLPRTSTRKVKRREVLRELERLQRAVQKASGADVQKGTDDWLHELMAHVAQVPRERVHPATTLSELGYDSLMYSELAAALEASGVTLTDADNLADLETVREVGDFVRSRRSSQRVRPPASQDSAPVGELEVPEPLVRLGRGALSWGQKNLYERFFDTTVTGRAYLPAQGPFLVAANHSSHLDMGLVKHALGDWGERLVALAAKDYFFEDRLKKMYFENFTSLVPMDRHGSLRESLRTASNVLREGHVLLMFPEGTRSRDGVMRDFKQSLGFLALSNRVDIVPMYLEGAHDRMPTGRTLPRRGKLAARIGPLITWRRLEKETAGMTRSESYRHASRVVEDEVRRQGNLPPAAPSLAAPASKSRPEALS